jgi:hypothetical protein
MEHLNPLSVTITSWVSVVDIVKIIKDVYLTTVKQILPDLAKSIEYLWEGLIGLGSWVGYAVAALYYFAAEAGQGKELCEASGIAF